MHSSTSYFTFYMLTAVYSLNAENQYNKILKKFQQNLSNSDKNLCLLTLNQ